MNKKRINAYREKVRLEKEKEEELEA